MKFQTCECGSTIFETIRTSQYDADDFNIDSKSTAIPVAVNCLPIARCMECARLIIPPTSLAGMSALDSRVKAYAELIRAVEVHNANVTNYEKVYTKALIRHESELQALRQKIAMADEEAKVVETTSGSRKKSKTVIS